MLISSRSNDRVKALRALRDRKDRDANGVFFAEGRRLVQAALDHNAPIELVVIAPDRLSAADNDLLDKLTDRRLPTLEVTPEVFDSIAFREEEQSMGIVVGFAREELSQVSATKRCWVALPEIQHPGNLGTVIRCVDAIGGDGVILVGRTTDPYHPIAVRGTLGAIFSQRIVRATESEFASWVLDAGCTVVGTSPYGDIDYRQVDYASKPVVMIMGSERIGISEQQSALCDHLVTIPMAGYVESLNLSIASALVLYEILRQVEPPASS